MIPMGLTEAMAFKWAIASGEFSAIIHTCGRMTFWKAQPKTIDIDNLLGI